MFDYVTIIFVPLYFIVQNIVWKIQKHEKKQVGACEIAVKNMFVHQK